MEPDSTKPRNIATRLREAMRSSTGKNLMLYLLFVLVAFAFWMMLSLDSEVQKDYDIPLQIDNVPDSVTVITDPPASINVSVRAKGAQLLRFSWGDVPTLHLDYRVYAMQKTSQSPKFALSRAKLEARLRDYFGAGVTIASVRPDSIMLMCTSMPGKRIKIHVNADLRTDLQCIVSGALKPAFDSVTVYSPKRIPPTLQVIETETITLTGLKDTTYTEVAFQPVAGMRISPSKVKVMIPVEPLIAKKAPLMIEVRGVPKGERVITFPSKIDVNYLVPISSFGDNFSGVAYVDYTDTYLPGDKVPLRLSSYPDEFHNVTFTPDSVEYLIER